MRRSGFWVCLIIAALACMLAPSLAMADIPYITFTEDETTGLKVVIHDLGGVNLNQGPESADASGYLSVTSAYSGPEYFRFNIWDGPGFTNISDTLQVELNYIAFFSAIIVDAQFYSSYPGHLSPLQSCSGTCYSTDVLETGSLQWPTYTTILGDPANSPLLGVGFVSGLDNPPVLEPSSILLLVIMLAGTALAVKKFRLV
jgi:hypothetical protein